LEQGKQMKAASLDNISIVIPAYNEEAALIEFLPAWLEHCDHHNWRLIVVDDGSSDRTPEILNTYCHLPRHRVIHHKVNRGYGQALKSGISASETEFTATMDADGQHPINSIEKLIDAQRESDADLVIGKRIYSSGSSSFRSLGKFIIRAISRLLIPNKITDLNSGIKLYRTKIVKTYLDNCPNTMAFSDVLTLNFLAEKQLVTETPVQVLPRSKGKSSINLHTAFDTVIEIVNIVMLFNPLRLFLPLAVVLILAGVAWGLPIVIAGRGVSVGSLLMIFAGGLCILLGLLAEQLSQIRKLLAKNK
jgi:glycosyltransferase involved in cell wall biosynthesis